MKKLFFFIAIAVMLSSSFFGHNLMSAMAKEPATASYHKYYTSIEIQEGDSLWTIAEQYREHSGITTRDYVKELKCINRLGEDTIHAGNYLTVFYYSNSTEQVRR